MDEAKNIQAQLRGVRDPGDAWVVAADGNRYWGRFGAAGLLALDPAQGVLMQHRVAWSDHGGTWGAPGGAINEGEAAIDAAVREAHEEAGVPFDAVSPAFTHIVDRGGWTYTTVVALVTTAFNPEITDPESVALEWVPVDEVAAKLLHPGFQGSWPVLQQLVARAALPNGDAGRDLDDLIAEGHSVATV